MITALYTTAAVSTITSEMHMRWILFDLAVLYHVIVRAFVMSSVVMTNADIFLNVFAHSFMHYFVIMLMFSTSDSIWRMYYNDKLCALMPVTTAQLHSCFDWWVQNRKTLVLVGDRWVIPSDLRRLRSL